MAQRFVPGDTTMAALTKIRSKKLRESFSVNKCFRFREFAETKIHLNGFWLYF